jgi:hypothetical protein
MQEAKAQVKHLQDMTAKALAYADAASPVKKAASTTARSPKTAASNPVPSGLSQQSAGSILSSCAFARSQNIIVELTGVTSIAPLHRCSSGADAKHSTLRIAASANQLESAAR